MTSDQTSTRNRHTTLHSKCPLTPPGTCYTSWEGPLLAHRSNSIHCKSCQALAKQLTHPPPPDNNAPKTTKHSTAHTDHPNPSTYTPHASPSASSCLQVAAVTRHQCPSLPAPHSSKKGPPAAASKHAQGSQAAAPSPLAVRLPQPLPLHDQPARLLLLGTPSCRRSAHVLLLRAPARHSCPVTHVGAKTPNMAVETEAGQTPGAPYSTCCCCLAPLRTPVLLLLPLLWCHQVSPQASLTCARVTRPLHMVLGRTRRCTANSGSSLAASKGT
jgi:hypothetical protein